MQERPHKPHPCQAEPGNPVWAPPGCILHPVSNQQLTSSNPAAHTENAIIWERCLGNSGSDTKSTICAPASELLLKTGVHTDLGPCRNPTTEQPCSVLCSKACQLYCVFMRGSSLSAPSRAELHSVFSTQEAPALSGFDDRSFRPQGATAL